MVDSAIKLMYAGGLLAAIVGAWRTYNKIQLGEDPYQVISTWFGGCIVLVVMAKAVATCFS